MKNIMCKIEVVYCLITFLIDDVNPSRSLQREARHKNSMRIRCEARTNNDSLRGASKRRSPPNRSYTPKVVGCCVFLNNLLLFKSLY